MKHLVGKLSDFAANAFAVVTLEGREIAHRNDGTRFRAFRNACPHRGAPLSSGVVSGTGLTLRERKNSVTGSKVGVLRCPWHGYEYSPKRANRSSASPPSAW